MKNRSRQPKVLLTILTQNLPFAIVSPLIYFGDDRSFLKNLFKIMALPGHRRTSSDKRRRAAHFALKKVNASVCPKCGEAIISHQTCKNCGSYKGRVILDTGKQAERVIRKAQARKDAPQVEEKTSEAGQQPERKAPKKTSKV